VTTTFGTVPGFDEQSIRTSIVLESGQTFAIGGLIQTSVNGSTRKVPVLGELPFISSAFSAVSHNEQEQELIILVTPHLVDPMDCNQVPSGCPPGNAKSDDFELYLESMSELPRGQRNVFEGKHYKAAGRTINLRHLLQINGVMGSATATAPRGACMPATKDRVYSSNAGELPPAVLPTEIPTPRGGR
jgi:Flp pilus assembly secretin CpaC